MSKKKNTDKLSFYDVKTKQKFVPSEFTVKVKSGRRFGVAVNPKSGTECWRVLGKEQ